MTDPNKPKLASQLFDPAIAEALAAEWNGDSGDDKWSYKARHDPSGKGKSVIDCWDEAGNYLGAI